MKPVSPLRLTSPLEEYDLYLTVLDDMKDWPDADVERLEAEQERVVRKRALAVSIRASQDGVRMEIQREHGTGDKPVPLDR